MDLYEESLKKAKTELNQARYLSEHGRNAGIREIYRNKSNWLSILIYFAERGKRKEDEGK